MAFRRALCLYAVGHVKEAEEAFWRLLEEDSFADEPYDALVGIYEETGRKQKIASLTREVKKMWAVQEREEREMEKFFHLLTSRLRKPGRR